MQYPEFSDISLLAAARDEALRDAVAHQKALTLEMRHRVRNNLQTINSLMNLQSWRAETAAEIATASIFWRTRSANSAAHSISTTTE